jgi:hypothetical protein
MSEYTDLIRESRVKANEMSDYYAFGLVALLIDRLADALEVSVARTAELEAVIESAPHAKGCRAVDDYYWWNNPPARDCNCWKSEALAVSL